MRLWQGNPEVLIDRNARIHRRRHHRLDLPVQNRRTKEFGALFGPSSKFTDDTVSTVAIAEALTEGTDPVAALQTWGRRYWDNGGWGQRFVLWLADDNPQPYGSYGNRYDESCQRTVPQALICALDASDFEDAIRNAISLGGDSDTLAAMAGSMAEVRFGKPEAIARETWARLPDDMRRVIGRLYAASSAIHHAPADQGA